MAEALWSGVARAYAQSFAGLCAGTIPAMVDGIPAGTRVLDVGCGTGAVLLAAREAGLDATGVEPDPEMAAMAGELLGAEVAARGLPDLPFATDSYDVSLANFVLNHVDDPRAAARELARVTAPDGVVRATIWPGYPPPQAKLWGEVLDGAGAIRPEMPRLAEDLDFERSVDGFSAMLTEAGLVTVSARTEEWTWRIDPDDLLTGMREVGNFGVTWRAQTPDIHERMTQIYADLTGPLTVGGVLELPVACVFVEARA